MTMVVYMATAAWAVALAFVARWVYMKKSLQSKPFVGKPVSILFQNGWGVFLLLAFASLLLPLLVSGLRYDVGTDYLYSYVPMFHAVGEGAGIGTSIEPGMWMLIKLLQLFGCGSEALFVATTLVILAFFWAGMFELSDFPWYSVALFFLAECFFSSMNAVQQYMGLAIVFWGFRYVRNPCFWKYALCVLAGCTFHFATIVMLPLFLFAHFKFHPVFGLGAVAVFTMLNAPINILLEWAISKTPYAPYIGSQFQMGYQYEIGKLVIHFFVLILAVYYYHQKDNAQDPLFRFLFYCHLLLTFLMMNLNIMPQANRIGISLEIVHLLLLPRLVMSEDNKFVRVAVAAIPALLWGQLLYEEVFIKGWFAVVPYQSVLFL